MSYLRSVLQPGETLLYESRISWTTFVPGLLVLLVALVVFILLRAWITTVEWPAIAVGLILLALSLLMLFRAWFERWTTEIAAARPRKLDRTSLTCPQITANSSPHRGLARNNSFLVARRQIGAMPMLPGARAA